jgi:SAM-dependent methyltransferase
LVRARLREAAGPAVARALRAGGAVRRRAVRPRTLLRAQPVSRKFGFDRGTPIDRVWIERFLGAEAERIRGSVLEIGDAAYTRRFGRDVTESHVLHATGDSPDATIVGDLATGQGVPDAAFDCIILTQTLPFIYDLPGTVATCRRALRPGGCVLATLPGISQISRFDMDRWGDFWRFTDLSARRLFAADFGDRGVTVRTHGNVGSACAFLHGLAAEEVDAELLDAVDPDYQVLITVVAAAPSS